MPATSRLLDVPPSPMTHLLGTPRDSQEGMVRLTELIAYQQSVNAGADESRARRLLRAAQGQRGLLLERMGRRFSGWCAEVASSRETEHGVYVELVVGSEGASFLLSNDHPEPPRGFRFALQPESIASMSMLSPGQKVRVDGTFLNDRDSRPLLHCSSAALGLFMPRFLVRYDLIAPA